MITIMQAVRTWSNGNPGAMTFLMELAAKGTTEQQVDIMLFLEQSTIRGTDLYILWSDLCGKDIERVHWLCLNCPQEILTDACSRQDYSGRQLVKPYFD